MSRNYFDTLHGIVDLPEEQSQFPPPVSSTLSTMFDSLNGIYIPQTRSLNLTSESINFGESDLDGPITNATSPSIMSMIRQGFNNLANTTNLNTIQQNNLATTFTEQNPESWAIGSNLIDSGTFRPSDTPLSTDSLVNASEVYPDAIETAETVESSVPGLGEYFAAGFLMNSVMSSANNSEAQTLISNASSKFNYGLGGAMNQQLYDSHVNADTSQMNMVNSYGSLFGPIGLVGTAIYNAFQPTPGSSVNLDTTYSTSGQMVDGTSQAVVSTLSS